MKSILAFAQVLLLGACVAIQPVTDEELKQASENNDRALAEAIPDNYAQLIAQRIRSELKDPYSIRDPEISRPGIGFIGILNGGQGVVVCARLNAKNSFGAYTGVRTWGFVFRSKAIAVQSPEGDPLACRGRSYFPFPELTA